jgi:hypothetical protein
MQIVLQYTPEQLFVRGPPQFAQILHYVRRLRFNQQPDYDYIDSLILQVRGTLCVDGGIHSNV